MHGQVTPLDRPLPSEIVSKCSAPHRPSRSQRAVRSAQKMHGQVTLLDRPLPPGEGRGEGLVDAFLTVTHNATLDQKEPPNDNYSPSPGNGKAHPYGRVLGPGGDVHQRRGRVGRLPAA